MGKSAYRPDIDGLRAVAVVSVLLYHFEVAGFSGGFVGVDVFFVISGFLITRLIRDELAATGRFDFKHFYVRRARRLLPALTVTLMATLAGGWLWLPPDLFRDAAWSVLASALSISNLYFASGAGDYFNAAAYQQPALHTWSLSVEEQFYLVWPLTLVLLTRYARPKVLAAVVVVAALSSFAAAQMWADRGAAFFLTPFRMFEFAIGAALVSLPTKLHGAARDATLLAGLGMIAAAVLTFDDAVRFPGVAALLPCAGAGLAIYAGEARIAGLALRNPVAVGLGLISYSLYLVHWPLFAFLRMNVGELGPADQVALLAASLVCATVLYVAIETPLRRRRFSGAALARFGVAGFGAVAVPAVAIALSGGVQGRYTPGIAEVLSPALVQESRKATWARLRSLNREFTDDSRSRMLVIGDSQAGDFVNLLAESALAGRFDVATFPSTKACQGLFDPPQRGEDAKRCADQAARLDVDRRVDAADVVVLSFAWAPSAVALLPANVARLKQLGARRVLVIGRKDQGASGPELLTRFRSFEGLEPYAAEHRNAEAWAVNRELAALAGPFEFVDIMRAFCPDQDRCHVVDDQKRPIFFDVRHISKPATPFAAGLVFERAGLLAELSSAN